LYLSHDHVHLTDNFSTLEDGEQNFSDLRIASLLTKLLTCEMNTLKTTRS